MSNFAERVINDDFVWNAIVSHHAGPRKRNSGGGFHINCPMCTSRGESADRKMRCGVKPDSGGVVINDFNCGFKARWRPGETLSRNMQAFLQAIGISETEVQRLNYKAFTYRKMIERSPSAMLLIPDFVRPSFQTTSLPKGAKRFEDWAQADEVPADFLDVATYLFGRGDEIATGATYYWTPDTRNGMNRRVIVPLAYDDRIVGYTARSIDPNTVRYHMEAQPNYLYNAKALTAPKRKYVILAEGIFDAIAIDGVGLLGARINAHQTAWIKGQGKDVILIPDQDNRGSALIDTAMENGWKVAFPAVSKAGASRWWDEGVKDCADAVKRYGRPWTILSIIESATSNKLEINFKRKAFT